MMVQVAIKSQQQAHSVKEEILREDGPAGLLRGVLPRMVSSAAWGSAMVMVSPVCRGCHVKYAYMPTKALSTSVEVEKTGPKVTSPHMTSYY
jgi:hypothetical protein